jgi:argininosuccinate lyase
VYRSRTTDSLDKDALNFLSSVQTDYHLLYYDILGSEAHVIMLHEIGFLSSPNLEDLLVGLGSIRNNPKVLSTEKFEDIHECIEAFLIAKLGNGVGGILQTARSRNDQVILDLRMMVRDSINRISRTLLHLIGALLSRSRDNFHSIMPMYTHLQQAQLGTFAHFLLSYAENLFRDVDRLNDSYNRINMSPLGACAIGGTSISIDRNRTASLLGFKGVLNNSIDATTSRDDLIEFMSSLSIIMLNLSRIAEDFILWSTTEFGFVEIPDKYSSSSSLMPQKKNPDTLELIRAKASTVAGNLFAAMSLVKGLPSGYSRDLQELKPGLVESSCIVQESLHILIGLIIDVKVNHARLLDAARNSYAISADIAEKLVLQKRVSFRSAHRVVGSLVRTAVERGNIPLSKLTESEVQSTLKEIDTSIEPGDVIKVIQSLSPEKSIEMRLSSGSPSVSQQQDLFDLLNEKKKAHERDISEREKCVALAFDRLLQMAEEHKEVGDL